MSDKTVLLKNADYLVRDYQTIEKKMSVVVEGNIIAGVGEAVAPKRFSRSSMRLVRGSTRRFSRTF